MPTACCSTARSTASATSYAVNFPERRQHQRLRPRSILAAATVRLVGSYKNSDYATAPVEVNGFLFEGTTADLGTSSNYRTIDYPGAKFNYVHSTMGGLAVGNYDSPVDHGTYGLPLGPGHAYIYDIASDTFLTDVVYPGSKSNTAYGIWYNGGTSYTICGGYSLDPVNNFDDQDQPIGTAYMVDYDSATGKFTHWTSFDYPDGTNFVTHFEGISSVEKGVYTLNADSVQAGTGDPGAGLVGHRAPQHRRLVRRRRPGSISTTPASIPTTNITSSNSVYGNQVVGIVIGSGGTLSLPGDRQHRLPVVERHQRQRRQRHRPLRRQRQPGRHELHRHRRHRHGRPGQRRTTAS